MSLLSDNWYKKRPLVGEKGRVLIKTLKRQKPIQHKVLDWIFVLKKRTLKTTHQVNVTV